MKHSVIYIIYLLLINVLTCSCEDTHDESIPTPKTVVVAYLAADDSSIASETVNKVNALADGFRQTIPGESRLLVYVDRVGQKPCLMEITHSSIDTLRQYSIHNSADAQIMGTVLQDALSIYPNACCYGLIIFSHGTAWLPQGAFENPYLESYSIDATRAIAKDQDNWMELPQFVSHLPIPAGRKWDFLLLENCYMGSLEVACQLKDKVRYLIASASEVISPGYTAIYPSTLHYLYEDTPRVAQVAQSFFDYWNSRNNPYRSATVAAFNLDYLDHFLSSIRSKLQSDHLDKINIASLQDFTRRSFSLFFDLQEVIETLDPSFMQTNWDALTSNLILYKNNTSTFMQNGGIGVPWFTIRRHCGLSIYIPQSQFPGLNQYYKDNIAIW